MEQSIAGKIFEYINVLVGAAFIAIVFNVFLLPNKVASGGVSGISTILYDLFGWEPAYVQWAFNIPLFIAGVVLLGKQFGAENFSRNCFFTVCCLPYKGLEPMDTGSAACFLIWRDWCWSWAWNRFSREKLRLEGPILPPKLFISIPRLSLGICVALLDGLIVLSAAIVFDIESGLYALLSLYVTSKTIDLVQVGLGVSKMAMIITNKQEDVREAIINKMDRGVTKLSGYGGYTDNERPILMCVFDHTEFTKLKQLVRTIDPTAFVIVMDAAEVLGEGFKRT